MVTATKPLFKTITRKSNSCFNREIFTGPELVSTWHYHQEVELILIKGSSGTRIVGNSVEPFADDELLLIGKNTPHAFLHDQQYGNGPDNGPQALVFQFAEEFLGTEFLKIPDLKPVRELLTISKQGLCVTKAGKKVIIPLLETAFHAPSFDAIILLLEILKHLTREGMYRTITNSIEYSILSKSIQDQRFEKVLEYTCANYDEHISINDVAKIAGLTKESFCRYFKVRTKKTYFEFLTELRIDKACQMILKSNHSIKEIGYSCGFDSLSNFYSQFRKVMKVSPLEFSGKKHHSLRKTLQQEN
ncbi:MAG: helix-turn-helix domain-containing protein [Chitinophagaceae bacterium]|nr:helix-turn-helix domain-containing protein [Chitinophagaceae bacterium]MCW5926035.1 helix-turn-helix domain-containing protein [Chitinophagaceae bacterium]